MIITFDKLILKKKYIYLKIIFILCFRYLGEKNYRFLRDLDTSYEPSAGKYTVTDERIIKNGFNVVIVFNGKLI